MTTTATDHPTPLNGQTGNMVAMTAEEHAAPARKRATFGVRACPECGAKFKANHPGAQFCTPAHKTAFHNRQKGRSHAIMYAMAYRQGRGRKGVAAEAFKELSRLLDRFNAEDRAAGRPSAMTYVEGLQRRQLWGQSHAYK